jgi:serine/threonine protein kinase
MHALNDPDLYGLTPGSAEEQAVLNDLIAEVTMLATLHSDKIVSFRGGCVDSVSGRPKFIILELASGSLEGYLRDVLTLPQFASLCEDVLIGMEYLHAQLPPIMHHDLKPANILLFNDGQGGYQTKLADLGETNRHTFSTRLLSFANRFF